MIKRDYGKHRSPFLCLFVYGRNTLYSFGRISKTMVDDVGGFLVLDKNGMPYIANHREKRFQYALGRYNRTYKEEYPPITLHVCRHTYCSNMAKTGVNVKILQYLMEHVDIATTLNMYIHLRYDDVEKEVRELEERLKNVK